MGLVGFMQFFHCLVRFSSSLALEEVGALLSKHVFGGIPFVTTREFDEVPGIRLQYDVLRLEIRICGESPHFGLHIDTCVPLYPQDEFPKLEIINIQSYVETALKQIGQLAIIPT
jgi:hypothetical protein